MSLPADLSEALRATVPFPARSFGPEVIAQFADGVLHGRFYLRSRHQGDLPDPITLADLARLPAPPVFVLDSDVQHHLFVRLPLREQRLVRDLGEAHALATRGQRIDALLQQATEALDVLATTCNAESARAVSRTGYADEIAADIGVATAADRTPGLLARRLTEIAERFDNGGTRRTAQLRLAGVPITVRPGTAPGHLALDTTRPASSATTAHEVLGSLEVAAPLDAATAAHVLAHFKHMAARLPDFVAQEREAAVELEGFNWAADRAFKAFRSGAVQRPIAEGWGEEAFTRAGTVLGALIAQPRTPRTDPMTLTELARLEQRAGDLHTTVRADAAVRRGKQYQQSRDELVIAARDFLEGWREIAAHHAPSLPPHQVPAQTAPLFIAPPGAAAGELSL